MYQLSIQNVVLLINYQTYSNKERKYTYSLIANFKPDKNKYVVF